METPKRGELIVITNDTGGRWEEIAADIQGNITGGVKGEIHVTVYTNTPFKEHVQYHIKFKSGGESLAVLLGNLRTNVKGRYAAQFATTIPGVD